MLRGVYFTSGTQEGSPIDRVLGTLARSFRLERPGAAAFAGGTASAGSGKSFFLMRLLRQYLRKELPIIHRNNIRFMVIGRPDQLPEAVRAAIRLRVYEGGHMMYMRPKSRAALAATRASIPA